MNFFKKIGLGIAFKKTHQCKLYICKDEKEIGERTSKMVIEQIVNKPNAVLGLATGSSPVPLYKELVKACKEKKVSFANIVSFNLDEYVDLDEKYFDQSYRNFMDVNLFNNVNILKSNTHFPSKQTIEQYDDEINKSGGIDLQVLGLGVNGHIAFNEPGTPFNAKTHLVKITDSTKQANARFFDNKPENVPSAAITMGIKTIMSAKKIILIATGKNKAEAISKLFKNKYNPQWPVTALIYHPDVSIFVDYQAASLIAQ